jgi:nucleoside-diphosphate-sugar epimerase
MQNLVAVSGATGWLGLETIERVLQFQEVENFSLYSSNGRGIQRATGAVLATTSFLSTIPPESLDGFIHLAFLTRDKVSSVGYSEYVANNISLISKACAIIESSRPKWVVLVSSGAIFDRTTGELETDSLKNPYGFCKRIEENLILDSARKVGANVVIGRLWGATGALMPPNSAYAISDFIYGAHLQRKIQIKSGGLVFRRYVDAGEFMETLIRAAISGEHTIINSGGPKIEIGELAILVSNEFSGVEILRPEQQDGADDYFPSGDEFESLALKVGVRLSDLPTQVSRTVIGHILAFRG